MTQDVYEAEQQRDAVSGARILVGHMLQWSDLDAVDVPVAVGALLSSLIAASRPRRVLLAGPRASLLVDHVPEEIPVDLLVRALSDARTLADRAGLHAEARLYCGGLDAFHPGRTYDLVVALGGPGLLLGPDSRGLSHAETVATLGALVAEGGRLVFDAINEVGVHDLVAGLPESTDSDRAWHVGAAGFDSRHPYRSELDAALTGAGLTTSTLYAAYPAPEHHVLVDTAALADPFVRERAVLASSLAMEAHFSHHPRTRDPRATVERVFGAGLVEELAPAWVVVASLQGHEAAAADVPSLLEAEADLPVAWSRVTTLTRSGESHTAWTAGRTDTEVSEGKISRDLVEPYTQPGRIFELELREACTLRSHTAVRAAVRRYAAWLTDAQVWNTRTADRRFYATPANLVVAPDGSLGLLDGSWRRVGIMSGEDALVRGLRDFSRRLLASASPHPWRFTITPDELTATLVAMAGVTVSPAMITRVARVEAEWLSVVTGRPEDVAELHAINLEQGAQARDLPAATSAGYRDLLAHDRAQARTLREKDGQVGWLEGTLRHRDRYIRQLEKIIERYEETLTYKTVQAIRAPRRIATEKAISTVKATANEALPPGAMSKLRRLAKRAMK